MKSSLSFLLAYIYVSFSDGIGNSKLTAYDDGKEICEYSQEDRLD